MADAGGNHLRNGPERGTVERVGKCAGDVRVQSGVGNRAGSGDATAERDLYADGHCQLHDGDRCGPVAGEPSYSDYYLGNACGHHIRDGA